MANEFDAYKACGFDPITGSKLPAKAYSCIEWIGTEGRGWNWGIKLTTRKLVFRFRLLSWAPFVRMTLRRNTYAETRIEGIEITERPPRKQLPPNWRRDYV